MKYTQEHADIIKSGIRYAMENTEMFGWYTLATRTNALCRTIDDNTVSHYIEQEDSMIELFREGVKKMLKAMDILEGVPEINSFHDDDVSMAYNALDDVIAQWKGALEECERLEEASREDSIKSNAKWCREHIGYQEDSILFTEEQADLIKSAVKDFRVGSIETFDNFIAYINAHTEKPLTFPCPECGEEMQVCRRTSIGRYYGFCRCVVGNTKDFDTKAELSEALNG